MKKIFILLAMLFSLHLLGHAQMVIWSDDCENATITASYTIIDNDGDGYNWEILSSPEENVHSGSYTWTSASYINDFGALYPDNFLITPQINIPAASTLSWWVGSQQTDSYYEEHYAVYISTTGNIDDLTLLYEETLNYDAAGTFVNRSADLSAYEGQIYIAFRHYNCSDMFMINLDDIAITSSNPAPVDPIDPNPGDTIPPVDPINPNPGDTTQPVDPINPNPGDTIPPIDPIDPNPGDTVSISDAQLFGVSIYPNPVTDVLNVQATGYQTIEIVNFLGQTVYNSTFTEQTMRINTAHMPAGVYFVKLHGDKIVTKKFVKQ